MSKEVKYRVKKNNGRVVGPFGQEQIFNLIEENIVSPNDEIQKFPDGAWIKVSSFLVEIETQKEKKEFPQEFDFSKQLPEEVEEESTITIEEKNDLNNEKIDKTVVLKNNLKEQVEKTVVFENPVGFKKEEPNTGDSINASVEDDVEEDDKTQIGSIDLENLKVTSVIKKENVVNKEVEEKKGSSKILIIAVVLAFVYFAFLDKEEEKKVVKEVKKLNIIFPSRYDKPDSTMSKELLSEAITLFNSYNYDNQIKSLDVFVSSIENDFSNNLSKSKYIATSSFLLNYIPEGPERILLSNTIFKLTQLNAASNLTDPNAAQSLALFFISQKRYKAAAKTIESFRLIKSNKPTIDLFGSYLTALFKSGDFDKAKKVYDQLIKTPKRSVYTNVQLFRYMFSIQEIDKAKEVFKLIESEINGTVYLLILQGDALISTGDFDKLENVITLIQQSEESFSPYSKAKLREFEGMYLANKGDIEEATKKFKESLTLFENEYLVSRLSQLDQNETEEVNKLILDSKIKTLVNLSRKHEKNKDFNNAFKVIFEAVNLDEENIEASLQLVNLQIQKSYFQEAIQTIEMLYKKYPKNLKIIYYTLKTYLKSYKYQDFDRLIRDVAQEGFGEDARFSEMQAMKYINKGDFALGTKWLQRAISINPLNDKLIYQLAKLYLDNNRLTQARSLLKRASDLDPSVELYVIEQSNIIYDTDGVDAAVGYLYKALERFPDSFQILSKIGIFYFNSGQLKYFEDVKSQIEKLNNKDDDFYNFMAEVYVREQKTDKAIESYKLAIRYEPGNLESRKKLAIILIEKEAYLEAVELLKQIQERLPTYPELNYYFATLHKLTGDYEQAIEKALEEIKANRSNEHAYTLLGDIYKEQEEFLLAEEKYFEAQKINSKNINALIGLAQINFMKNQFAIALDLYNKAKAISPDNAEVYRLLGDVYRKTGQGNLAVESYKTYLELSPGSLYKSEIQKYINLME